METQIAQGKSRMSSSDMISLVSLGVVIISFLWNVLYGYGSLTAKVDAMQEDVSEIRTDVRRLDDKMERRFEKIDQQFEKVDQRFEKVDRRFDKIENNLKQIEENTHKLDIRVTTLEQKKR